MPLTSRSAVEAVGALRGSHKDRHVRLGGFPYKYVFLMVSMHIADALNITIVRIFYHDAKRLLLSCKL